jgi:DNA-directed RNA polymerase specialized sigma24 family protein
VLDRNPPDHSSDFLRELLDIMRDPRVRSRARRLVGDYDLAEDLIQETVYLLSRVPDPGRIVNLRAFFWTVMNHEAARLRSMPRTIPLDDLERVFGARPVCTMTSRPLDEGIAARLIAEDWLARLDSRREQLKASVPGRSADHDRYRTVIVVVAESMLQATARGEYCEENPRHALEVAYPEYFDEPGRASNSCDQRFSRARMDVRNLLKEVVARNELLSDERQVSSLDRD